MSWLEKNRKINNRGGGGYDYSGLGSTDMPGCKLDNKKTNLKAIESSLQFFLFVPV